MWFLMHISIELVFYLLKTHKQTIKFKMVALLGSFVELYTW